MPNRRRHLSLLTINCPVLPIEIGPALDLLNIDKLVIGIQDGVVENRRRNPWTAWSQVRLGWRRAFNRNAIHTVPNRIKHCMDGPVNQRDDSR
jgi:hypothetical protein